MDGSIGTMNWEDCEYCVHYRPDVGGCIPLEKVLNVEDLFTFDVYTQSIICKEFKRLEE